MERWTVREPVSGKYKAHINSGGRYPGSWGEFEYRTAFDLGVDYVEVVHPTAFDFISREHFASLSKGIERGWTFARERGRLITSLRIEIIEIGRHPADYELRGSSHGGYFLSDLVHQHGVTGPILERAWFTSTVVALARGIYEERAFDRMPILADALQDAGCDNEDVLKHCRDEKATHVRGCWVVDLLLGKS